MDQTVVAVDSQILNGIQSCMMKYHYSFERHLRPNGLPEGFERGDLVHKMLQCYYTLKKYRTRWPQNNKTHKDIILICQKIGVHFASKMNLQVEDSSWVIETFRQYAEHYEIDGWDSILFVERPFSFLLYEDPKLMIVYQGKIDLIISISNCPVLPIDHKSMSRNSETSLLSNQFMGYCAALGVNNLIINKVGFQKTLKPEEKFLRPTLSYSNTQLAQWKENSVSWIRYALDQIAKGDYPMNLTSCDKYSGCLYKSLCESDKDIREWKIGTLYTISDKWDPGKTLV